MQMLVYGKGFIMCEHPVEMEDITPPKKKEPSFCYCNSWMLSNLVPLLLPNDAEIISSLLVTMAK